MAAFDEKDYTKSFDWSIWKRLTPFVRPFRRDFVGMLVFNGLCALVDVAIPLFQRYAIRNFIQADSLRGIVPFSLVYLLVIVLQALSVVAFARNSMTIEMNMGRDMRRSLFHHLQTLSFSFYNVTPVGYLLTRVMSDTNRIASMIAWNMTDILWALFYVLGTFAAMLALNWRLALVVIVIVPVMAVLTGYFQNRILRWNRKVRKLNSRITGSFNEGITGAKTTKTLGTEEQTVAAFRDLTRQMHDAGIGAARLNAVYIPLVLFASTMAVAIVLLRGGYMVSDHLLELATLSTFTTYAVGIFEPIQMTAANIHGLLRVRTGNGDPEHFRGIHRLGADHFLQRTIRIRHAGRGADLIQGGAAVEDHDVSIHQALGRRKLGVADRLAGILGVVDVHQCAGLIGRGNEKPRPQRRGQRPPPGRGGRHPAGQEGRDPGPAAGDERGPRRV